jgi:hypothetical protein
MLFGPYQIQIFTSLVLILGAAFVALICDLLKGNNEQLRELAIELKVRREEEHKRFQMLVPQTASATHAVTQKAETAIRKMAAPAARSLATPEEKKRTVAPAALAAMERGAQLAAAPRPRRQVERPVEPLVEPRIDPRVEPVEPRVEPVPVEAVSPVEVISPVELITEVVAAPAASVRVTPRIRIKAPPSAQQSTRDWSSLLTARRSETAGNSPQEKPGLLDAVVAAQAAEPVLPAGFQDGFVLTRLVESHQPVSGLVVSIGVSAANNQDGSLAGNVRTLIQSLIGPTDFAAQSGEEEFLLIYPGERGAAAQRRLSQVAQQLWDFQLRSLGSYSIQFSWGGVEVRSESISEAIASATERMQETRRGRKILTMESRPAAETPVRRAM